MTPSAHRQLVTITLGPARLEGVLALPPQPSGMVLFAHGSGSSRLSPRNNAVASQLRQAGFGTLLMDLLSEDEEHDTGARFDIFLLEHRLAAATEWLARQPLTSGLPLGLFGASTGAAAALALAAAHPEAVGAVVARGGRPDLASEATLRAVRAPTLLIVGALDTEVAGLNQDALGLLGGHKKLVIVPGASHLFEEEGCLETVGKLAGEWFVRYLAPD